MPDRERLTRERVLRLEAERNELNNSFGGGGFIDGLIRDRIAYIDQVLREGEPSWSDPERT